MSRAEQQLNERLLCYNVEIYFEHDNLYCHVHIITAKGAWTSELFPHVQAL